MKILKQYIYFDSCKIANKLLHDYSHVRVTYKLYAKGIEVVFIDYGHVLGFLSFRAKDGKYYRERYMFRDEHIQNYIEKIGIYLPEDKVIRLVKGEMLHECFEK